MSFEHFCRRFARLAVERKDGHLAPRVAIVRRFDHVVLQVGTKAVLRAKERDQRALRVVPKTIRRVPELRVDGRRIAHETDTVP